MNNNLHPNSKKTKVLYMDTTKEVMYNNKTSIFITCDIEKHTLTKYMKLNMLYNKMLFEYV